MAMYQIITWLHDYVHTYTNTHHLHDYDRIFIMYQLTSLLIITFDTQFT